MINLLPRTVYLVASQIDEDTYSECYLGLQVRLGFKIKGVFRVYKTKLAAKKAITPEVNNPKIIKCRLPIFSFYEETVFGSIFCNKIKIIEIC